MEMARPRLGGPESSAANTQDAARLGVPYTEGAQINQDWRAALRATRPWQAGTIQAQPPLKAGWTWGVARLKRPCGDEALAEVRISVFVSQKYG